MFNGQGALRSDTVMGSITHDQFLDKYAPGPRIPTVGDAIRILDFFDSPSMILGSDVCPAGMQPQLLYRMQRRHRFFKKKPNNWTFLYRSRCGHIGRLFYVAVVRLLIGCWIWQDMLHIWAIASRSWKYIWKHLYKATSLFLPFRWFRCWK